MVQTVLRHGSFTFQKKTRSSVASPAKRGIFGLARNEDAGSSHGEARYPLLDGCWLSVKSALSRFLYGRQVSFFKTKVAI